MNDRARDAVNDYLETWNSLDASSRASLLEAHSSPAAMYCDPLAEAHGRAEISALIAGVHAQFAGFKFSLIGEPDAHHAQVRFQWGLGPAGSEPVVIGFDVMTLDEDGRIHRVFGFLDKTPS